MGARERRSLVTAALAAPAAVWLLLFLALPFVAMLVFAFGHRAPAGGYLPGFTFEQFLNLPARATAFANTLLLAPAGGLLCLLVAYPVAYYLALRCDPRYRLVLVSLIVVPFWTSLLVRTYAWMYILGSRGLPNLLEAIGLPDIRMLNTPGAVLIGIVYGYLPLMIMPIYVSLEKLDRRLLDASADLGARPMSTFFGVTLPLSMPGVIAGFMLVFVPAIGEFVIHELLGGPDTLMIGRVLWNEFFSNRDWPVASAVAIAMLVILVVPIMILRNAQARQEEG